MGLATLVLAQHIRPPQFLPLTFVPVLLGSSYLNLYGYTTDSAGVTAAWSGLYFLLASRRKVSVRQKFGPRGILRGSSMGLCAVNVACCGFVYATGKRDEEEE